MTKSDFRTLRRLFGKRAFRADRKAASRSMKLKSRLNAKQEISFPESPRYVALFRGYIS